MNSKDLKELICAGLPVNVESVPMPEWGKGVVVHLKEVTAEERDNFEAGTITNLDLETATDEEKTEERKVRLHNLRALWLCLCICDKDTKESVFTTEADAVKLGKCPAKDIDKLWTKSQEMNGVENDLDTAVKNSNAKVSEDSLSG